MTDFIQVGAYVQYRNKIYKVVETNRLTSTAKLKYSNKITEPIPFDELEEIPF